MKKYNFLDLIFSEETSAEEYYRCVEANKELKELHEACNNYKKMYVSKMAEVKKLKAENKKHCDFLKCHIKELEKNHACSVEIEYFQSILKGW